MADVMHPITACVCMGGASAQLMEVFGPRAAPRCVTHGCGLRSLGLLGMEQRVMLRVVALPSTAGI